MVEQVLVVVQQVLLVLLVVLRLQLAVSQKQQEHSNQKDLVVKVRAWGLESRQRVLLKADQVQQWGQLL